MVDHLTEYKKIVTEIESLGIMPDTAPSLIPIKKALELILTPSQFNPRNTIVVAGTNGKGSVCATLESLFLATGETVGLFTSPHLEETTERIKINGKEISQELFCRAYLGVLSKTKDLRLTHFEVLTAMAAWLFFSGEAIPPVQRPIFEVGLGGTWDATNAIPHNNCVITSLGFDHQNLLGNTLKEIATNKFGIVQQGANVIYSPFPNEAKAEISALAHQIQNKTNSHWSEADHFEFHVLEDGEEPQFEMHTRWGNARLSLAGERAAINSATALTAFAKIGYDPTPYLPILNQIQWPCRMERIKGAKPCSTYLSGDHNSQGSESLVQLLKHYKRKRLHLLVGIGRDKDLDGILVPLFSIPNVSIYLTETPFKGRSLDDYGKWMSLSQGFSKNPLDILRKIQAAADPQDMIVITGSLYLVGQLRSKVGTE